MIILTDQHQKKHCLLLISPVVWFRCFALVFRRTRARTRSACALQYTVLSAVILLMLASCYLFYAVTSDSGEYNLYLSNVASNQSSMVDGKALVDALMWRTVLKTFFLGVIFGLIQACNFFLAASWRQRICDRFQELVLQGSDGCVLYDVAQNNEDFVKVITNDVKQFTSNFAAVLFGSMFFSGGISVVIVIIIACAFLISASGGDFTGILICFGAFLLCLLVAMVGSRIYTHNLLKQVAPRHSVKIFVRDLALNV